MAALPTEGMAMVVDPAGLEVGSDMVWGRARGAWLNSLKVGSIIEVNSKLAYSTFNEQELWTACHI